MRVGQIIFKESTYRKAKLDQENTSFVHYTNADVAFKIIKHRQIWMKNAIAMNDFSEVQHGELCLGHAWNSDVGQDLKSLLEEIYPGIVDAIMRLHHQSFNTIRADTYLTCVSEHDKAENTTGRLSMWRAYGSDNGVALVFDNGIFFRLPAS